MPRPVRIHAPGGGLEAAEALVDAGGGGSSLEYQRKGTVLLWTNVKYPS
jgi:hypothetical protein